MVKKSSKITQTQSSKVQNGKHLENEVYIQDCFERPICSAPDAWFDVVKRVTNDNNKILKRTENVSRCLNLGSYNYLGFAASDEYCSPRIIECLKTFSASTCSTRVNGGTTTVHTELEEHVAKFVGKPAAILRIWSLQGGLIISDSLNHGSIVNGARGSGATICVFQHNTPSHLERVLRENIAEGQPRTHRRWTKIIVVVEGIYSMEGELCKLSEIIAICKKYKAYVYLDEAHSIGAVGKTGKGVCELLGVDTADVDVMMGTFTKSFGSCGGYIAGSEELIEYLKYTCPAHLYAISISPPAAQQIISAIKVLLGEDGSNRGAQKIARLRENSNFFRSELQKMGFDVLGDYDSPVMPIMLYNIAKLPAFSRECLKQNVAVVVVAFPATPLLLARARICISAAHSREDLIKALENMCSVYVPHVGLDGEEKKRFWEALDKVVRSMPSFEKIVVAGDFNGYIRVFSEGYDDVYGGFGFGERNEKGVALLDFARAFGMVAENSSFSKEEDQLITFRSAIANT
ncbi:Long chain base biosynthesis protein 2a [Capsicum annuum]|uniref:Long chain base biosynthesis protein 2a n=1 Tax=Capsicum annuum TaxID=4072 RepID=A0A2G2YED8_CAPAN|nr:Long chain base biosynthesis protein 2a [Capsicum annuum]